MKFTPQERRILVVVLTVVVVVLNALFVWPRFKDRARLEQQLANARQTLQAYQAEVARIPEYRRRLESLERQGSAVLPEAQALQLMRTVQSQAVQFSVDITSARTLPANPLTSTNTFFDEQAVAVGVNTRDKELIDFLIALGSGSSLIRVRDLTLRPDPPLYRLNGEITLVASYQKGAKPAAAAPLPGPTPAATASNAPRPAIGAVTTTKKKS